MTRQGNLDRTQEWPWCQILVHITDFFAQDGLLPEALVPSSRTFRWIRGPSVLGRLQACRQTRWRVIRLTVSCSLQSNIFGRMGSLGTVLGAICDLPKRKVPWAFPKASHFQLGSPAMLHEMCRGSSFVDLTCWVNHFMLASSKFLRSSSFSPSGTMQRETNVAEAAGASSEDDVMERFVRAISARQHHRGRLIKHLSLRARQPTGHCRPSDRTGGNGGQSSPAVGTMPTTSMH